MELPTKRAVSVCATYAVLSGLMCARLFAEPHALGHYDWDIHLFYYAAVLESVVEYVQWPFWNPWYCGGNVLWQNPQVALLSPAYPLALVTSLALAMKLNIVFHYWIGFIGMHLLLRRVIGVRSLPLVVFLACVFVASGALALHLAEGHSTFLPAFYLPLQLFWLCRAVSGAALRDALLAGALLALTVINGGLHIVPIAVTGFGTFAVAAAATRRRGRALLVLIVYGLAAAAYAAPKLVPVAAYLQSERFVDERARELGRHEPMTAEMVAHAYLDPHQTGILKFRGQLYGWHEYGNYIGLPAALLIVGSVGWAFVRRNAPARPAAAERSAGRWLGLSLASASLMLFALSLGDFPTVAPAALAHHIPLLSRFRIPSRYTIGFVLFGTATAGWALRDLSWDVVPTRSGEIIVAAICLAASADVIWRNGTRFEEAFDQRPLDGGFIWRRRPSAPITDTAIDPYQGQAPMLHALVNGRSTFNCYEPLKLIPVADPAQPLVFSDGGLKVTSVVFTPNRIDVGVVGGPAPSRLFVNQSYEPGWRSTLGAVSADPRYRNIAVSAPPWTAGRHSIAFVPRGLTAGFLIFGAAMLASVGFWNRRR